MKIRTLLIDDEPIARRGLRNLLKTEPDIEIIGECGDGLQAVEEIAGKQPDLVLLDIQMPELDGFSVIETLGMERMPLFIFVTAFDDFALQAFRVHALDYLLKPIKAPLLQAALTRARTMLAARNHQHENQKLAALLRDLNHASRYAERLVVKEKDGIVVLKVREVQWFEAYGDYVRIYQNGKKHLLREKIGALEQRLDPKQFLRIHRSAIVKLDGIKTLMPLTNGDYNLTLTDGTRLTLSRTYREKFFAHLQ
ncbi:response regulator transcription factor [candidate division KSB1 bacterium]|nr:response regulator transcription factor [candidate division KSB1 bacterium]